MLRRYQRHARPQLVSLARSMPSRAGAVSCSDRITRSTPVPSLSSRRPSTPPSPSGDTVPESAAPACSSRPPNQSRSGLRGGVVSLQNATTGRRRFGQLTKV
jgi:hypothetical protein